MAFWLAPFSFRVVIREFTQQTILIECGAEKTQGDVFVAGDYELEGGNARSGKKNRSGKYSLALDKHHRSGYGIEFNSIEKGMSFVVSVWKDVSQSVGSIRISGDGPDGGRLQSKECSTTHSLRYAR